MHVSHAYVLNLIITDPLTETLDIYTLPFQHKFQHKYCEHTLQHASSKKQWRTVGTQNGKREVRIAGDLFVIRLQCAETEVKIGVSCET